MKNPVLFWCSVLTMSILLSCLWAILWRIAKRIFEGPRRKTIPLLFAMAGSSLLVPSAHAVLGVGDTAVVYDPTMHATDTAKWSWEQVQWAEKLAMLHDTLVTVREHLQIAIDIKRVMGDPSSIVGLLDDLALDGMLSESGILDALSEFGGIIQEGATLAMQLEYLGRPIELDGWKRAARAGNFYAYSYNEDPLEKYIVVERMYVRYNQQVQRSTTRADHMRRQLNRLQGRLNSATTDAEVQKVKGSLTTADAALQDIEKSIELSSEQIQVARAMAVNRADQEREAYRASVDELVHEVEANLELPIEEVSTAEPNFELVPEEISTVTPEFTNPL